MLAGDPFVRTISSRHNSVVASFRALAATPDPAGRRVLLDGAHLVGEALDAGLDFEVILVAASRNAAGTEAGRLARELEQRGLPLVEADATLVISPGRRPRLIRVVTSDYWEAPPSRESDHFWPSFDVDEVGSAAAVRAHVPAGRVAHVGEPVDGAEANPPVYVYDTSGDKARTLQFNGAGIITPTSLAFGRDGRLLVTPGCYEFDPR